MTRLVSARKSIVAVTMSHASTERSTVAATTVNPVSVIKRRKTKSTNGRKKKNTGNAGMIAMMSETQT